MENCFLLIHSEVVEILVQQIKLNAVLLMLLTSDVLKVVYTVGLLLRCGEVGCSMDFHEVAL